jgi:hypothetical protein
MSQYRRFKFAELADFESLLAEFDGSHLLLLILQRRVMVCGLCFLHNNAKQVEIQKKKRASENIKILVNASPSTYRVYFVKVAEHGGGLH